MLAVGIVAHTARAAEAKALNRAVKADFVSIDNGMMGADNNHFTVQGILAEFPSTWSIVLEDDAEPVEGFRAQARAALIMAPSPIVSFYYGKQRPQHWQHRMHKALTEANAADTNWIISTHMLHAVGYAIRTELLPSLLRHESTLPADQHIGDWARRYGHTIAYTNPSLVDHLDIPTIVDHPDGQPRRPGRKAWNAGTRTHWTTEAVMLR